MIKVTMNGLHLMVEGHAMFAEAGKDIVCAAASTLAFTLARRMEQLENEGMASFDLQVSAGVFNLHTAQKSKDCQVSYDTIRAGFEMLAAKYPDHIQFIDMG